MSSQHISHCVAQESPVHTLASLDTLLSMANKKGKRERNMAVGECCVCVWGGEVLVIK